MFVTGIGDEAGDSIESQIKALKALGWNVVELRKVGTQNIHDLPEREFEIVLEKLSDANISVVCFSSTVANWACDPRSDEDFANTQQQLERAITRMHKCGCKLLRGMSFRQLGDLHPYPANLEKKIFDRVRTLVERCADNGITYLHENCMNFGGMSWEHTLRLADSVASENFSLLFDTGNPVFSWDFRGQAPYVKQDSWEFYKNVRHLVTYVHIKDCIYLEESEGLFPKARYTLPGDGHGHVRRIINDLKIRKFDGGISIEPHISTVLHEDTGKRKGDFESFVTYGKRLEAVIRDSDP